MADRFDDDLEIYVHKGWLDWWAVYSRKHGCPDWQDFRDSEKFNDPSWLFRKLGHTLEGNSQKAVCRLRDRVIKERRRLWAIDKREKELNALIVDCR